MQKNDVNVVNLNPWSAYLRARLAAIMATPEFIISRGHNIRDWVGRPDLIDDRASGLLKWEILIGCDEYPTFFYNGLDLFSRILNLEYDFNTLGNSHNGHTHIC
jgi:hypothetical protein